MAVEITYVTNIYGYNLMYFLCYGKLLLILIIYYFVTSLLNLSKYFAYKLSYAVLDSLYCQWKYSDFCERVPPCWEPVFLTQYCVG